MKRTKGKTLRRNKRGPASLCTKKVVKQAYELCLLGATNKMLAEQFNVKEGTIDKWYREYPDFKRAVTEGRMPADANVAKALYTRAIGFSHPAVKIFMDRRTEKEYDSEGNIIREKSYGVPVKVDYMEYYPPDVKAQTKWLNARQRLLWNDRIQVDHNHRHLHAGQVDINHVMEQISDTSDFTDEELKLAAKLGLDRALKEHNPNEN